MELLMVWRQAREEKPTDTLKIQGDEVRVETPEGLSARIKVHEFISRITPHLPDSAGTILPDGVKCMFPMSNGVILVHETPPRVYSLQWIARDSEAEYGPGTRYRSVRIALPYLIVLAVFEGAHGGVPTLSQRNECFFQNQPLDTEGVQTELFYPALLNCSRFADVSSHPLSWICTQYLRPAEYAGRRTLEQSLRAGLQALLRHLVYGRFNRSSEHHEMNSWYSESVQAGIDPRVSTVEAWEKATAEDPLFVLLVPWLRTGLSLQQVAERIAKARRSGPGNPTCAKDLARVVLNRPTRRRRR